MFAVQSETYRLARTANILFFVSVVYSENAVRMGR